jgi:predicted transcriptional regulator
MAEGESEAEVLLRLIEKGGPITLDDLSAQAGLGLGRVNNLLCELHLGGEIRARKERVRRKLVTVYVRRIRGVDP